MKGFWAHYDRWEGRLLIAMATIVSAIVVTRPLVTDEVSWLAAVLILLAIWAVVGAYISVVMGMRELERVVRQRYFHANKENRQCD